jgi:hypothetical protein
MPNFIYDAIPFWVWLVLPLLVIGLVAGLCDEYRRRKAILTKPPAINPMDSTRRRADEAAAAVPDELLPSGLRIMNDDEIKQPDRPPAATGPTN